jgi:carboxymethylenebutenolidase
MDKMITIDGVPVYRVEPTGVCRGGVIVVHEIWGLNDHTKNVAKRFAAEGYLVLAPDLLFETTIKAFATPEMQEGLFNPKTRNEMQPKLRSLMAPIQAPEFGHKTAGRIKAIFEYLHTEPLSQQKVGIVGYCFGGSTSFTLAVHEPRLKAAVPYYGHANQLRSIACPILAFYGETDERLIDTLPDLAERMQEAAIDFSYQIYKDSGHAFFNDANRYAYNKDAADDSWHKTLSFLASSLSR